MTQDKAAKVTTKGMHSRRILNNADSCLQTKKEKDILEETWDYASFQYANGGKKDSSWQGSNPGSPLRKSRVYPPYQLS
jgi:hypothetical protein